MPDPTQLPDSSQPKTAKALFRILEQDLDENIRTMLSVVFETRPSQIPIHVFEMTERRIRAAFLGPDDVTIACQAEIARSMQQQSYAFEAFARDHEILQTLMLSSLLTRTDRADGLGEIGVGIFVRAMNQDLMGVRKALDLLDAQARAETGVLGDGVGDAPGPAPGDA